MLILERPWTRQPQGAVKGKTYGIGAGLVAYGTGAVNNDWEGVNNPTQVVGAAGTTRSFVSASSQYIKKNVVVSTPLTLFALFKRNSVSAADQTIISVGASTNNRHLLYFATSIVYMFSGSDGTYGQASSSVAISSQTDVFSVVGRVQSSNSRQIFINGVQRGTDTTAVSPAASSVCAVGAYWTSGAPVGGLYLDGDVAVWGVWNRALTDSEIMSLYVNPWQLFAPQQIYIPTATAAGYTHPTLSLATAIDVTATSFKPRVTYTFA